MNECTCVWTCMDLCVCARPWHCSGKGWTSQRERVLLAVHLHPIKPKYPLSPFWDGKQHVSYLLWPIKSQTIWTSYSPEHPLGEWMNLLSIYVNIYVYRAAVHCKPTAAYYIINTPSLSCWYSWTLARVCVAMGFHCYPSPYSTALLPLRPSLSKMWWNLLGLSKEARDVWCVCVCVSVCVCYQGKLVCSLQRV